MIYYLMTGIALGLSSGVSPGPLFALVISETLNYGRREGIKVAISPLITDVPIIALSYIVIDLFANSDVVYGILALTGGIFIAYLSYHSFQLKEIQPAAKAKARSIQKGVLANFLNPAPYIFWITVGIPTVLRGYQTSLLNALLFIIPFYMCLVGSKIILAVLVSRTGKVNPRILRKINLVLGILLGALAIKFLYDGVIYLR